MDNSFLQPGPDEATIKDLLESLPPSTVRIITQTIIQDPGNFHLSTPELTLYCSNEKCEGDRFFATGDKIELNGLSRGSNLFLTYRCNNCGESEKRYAIVARMDRLRPSRTFILKVGEDPPFGPRVPSRLISLVGSDRENFLKGRRSESQGLGIGAFTYYRRVIEDQKNRILDEIIRVAKTVDGSQEMVNQLEAAKREAQFTKAIEAIKSSIPQQILIKGHNPLTLLHSALSEGIHEHTDSECLQLAINIRVVMTEFAERLTQALKDVAELNLAVAQLMKPKGKKQSEKSS